MAQTGDRTSFPIVEETARIAKRVERTTVRVSSSVRHDRVPVETTCRTEEVVVERFAKDQWVDGPLPPRDENGSTIFSVVEEVPVVVKRYRLTEEVRVGRRVRTTTVRDEVEVARTEISVDRIPTQESKGNDAP